MAKKTTEKQNPETTDPKTGAKKGKTVAPKETRRPQQMKLPAEGMSRKAIAEIDRAAEKYRAARDERQEHTKLEKAAKTVLLDVVKKHLGSTAKDNPKGIATYVYEAEGEEFEVRYIAKSAENVKVKEIDNEDDADDGDDE